MSKLTRRQLIQSGLAVSACSVFAVGAKGAEALEPSSTRAPGAAVGPSVASATRERVLLDAGWKFSLGNADLPAKDFRYSALSRERTFAKAGAIEIAKAKFDDSSWRTLNLPHDWAIELPYISEAPAPEEGGKPLGREFPETSIGWYRKRFSLSAADRDKRVQLLFDGIYRNANVYLNGHYLATNFSGYAPLLLDVTDWVETEKENILVVRCDATEGDGWFYEGAGIYRHVWLIKTAKTHLVEWGTYVRSEVNGPAAAVTLGSEVKNSSDSAQKVSVSWKLLDANGATVAATQASEAAIAPGEIHLFEGQTTLRSPKLWSPDEPYLYKTVATVHTAGAEIDTDATTFGIRTLHFDADKGFFLNGKHTKIMGTCCHQDHAGVGAALPDRIQYFRIERLKSMGSNALRTSHNPPTPELMDATDSLGMLVMCETRMMDSSPEGLSQLERMVRRFRNHPSIFIWSLGNEEPEQGSERGARIVATMKQLTQKLDPTRLCTVAMNHDAGKGVSAVVDVQGFNYHEKDIDPFHAKFPKQPCIGTETASSLYTRGIYSKDEKAGFVSAYDENKPSWGSQAEEWWKFYDSREFLAGGFAWTGFDYRGEPTPYSWPCVSSHFGIMDVCGFPKDAYYYYKSWWGTEPTLHLLPHWSWPESKRGEEIRVVCYSNLDSVELFLNGQSLGVQTVPHNSHVEWKVKYEPGTLEARASRNGKVELVERRETTGAPAKIALRADRIEIDANGEDVAMITVEVQDAQGRLAPEAGNDILFAVSGSGQLLGLGNGNPSSHEIDKDNHRRVFSGLAQAIVQSSTQAGEIIVQAASPGLESATLRLQARKAIVRL